MRELPKLLIIGHAGHGKDSVSEILTEKGFKCLLSSKFALTNIMIPYFQKEGIIYPTYADCFADRNNCRDVWKREIENYNAPTFNRITRETFAAGYDAYIGMRSRKEFEASREFYDFVLWVDASTRLPQESTLSNELDRRDADFVIDNNGPEGLLKAMVGMTLEVVMDAYRTKLIDGGEFVNQLQISEDSTIEVTSEEFAYTSLDVFVADWANRKPKDVVKLLIPSGSADFNEEFLIIKPNNPFIQIPIRFDDYTTAFGHLDEEAIYTEPLIATCSVNDTKEGLDLISVKLRT